MSAPAAKGLLDLTRAYRRGELTRERYRDIRVALVNGERIPIAAEAGTRERRRWLPIAVLGAVVLAAVLLFTKFLVPTPQAGSPMAATAASAEGPVHALVSKFFARDRWDRPAVDGFLVRWAALPLAARRSAQDADWLRPMLDELHERLMEQRALAAAGDEQAIAGVTTLTRLRRGLNAP